MLPPYQNERAAFLEIPERPVSFVVILSILLLPAQQFKGLADATQSGGIWLKAFCSLSGVSADKIGSTAGPAGMTNEEKLAAIEATYARSRRLFSAVPELTIEELDRLAASTPVVLVDVRAEKEQEVSMIPGAMTAREFERSPQTHAGKTIVAYCTIGHRSGLYAKKLLAAGWQAFNLKGAILAWTHAGRELSGDTGPTRRVHVAGAKWSFEADGYDAIW